MSKMMTLNDLAQKFGYVAEYMFLEHRNEKPSCILEIGGDKKVIQESLDRIMRKLWDNFFYQPWSWQLDYKGENKWELSLAEADTEPEWPDFNISFSSGDEKVADKFVCEEYPEDAEV